MAAFSGVEGDGGGRNRGQEVIEGRHQAAGSGR